VKVSSASSGAGLNILRLSSSAESAEYISPGWSGAEPWVFSRWGDKPLKGGTNCLALSGLNLYRIWNPGFRRTLRVRLHPGLCCAPRRRDALSARCVFGSLLESQARNIKMFSP